MATIPHGGRMRDRLTIPEQLPGWLTAEDLDFYVSEFERTGLTGGLNRYRNVDRDWEDLAALTGQPITVPSLFIGGEKDGPKRWVARRSLTSTRRCLGCVARTFSADAAIGCSRSGQ